MAAEEPLPGEEPLYALAALFIEAERTVRELLRQAPGGDRRSLLAEALAVLLGLRREAQGAGAWVVLAYVVARDAVAAITGRAPLTVQGQGDDYGRDLGRRLAVKLDRLAVQADGNAREAFSRTREDNLADTEHLSVTGRVDRLGRRQTIAAEASMLTATSARHATTRATLDALPPGELVRFKTSGKSCSICKPHRGKTYQVEDTPRPPLHPTCDCILVPVDATPARLISAMRVEAVKRFYEKPARRRAA